MRKNEQPRVVCATPLQRGVDVPAMPRMTVRDLRRGFNDDVLHSAVLDVHCSMPKHFPATEPVRVVFLEVQNVWTEDTVHEMREPGETVLGVQPPPKVLEQLVLRSGKYLTSLAQVRFVMRHCELYRQGLVKKTRNPSHKYGVTPHFCFLRTGRDIRIVLMPPMGGQWGMIVENFSRSAHWGPTAIVFAPKCFKF